MSKNIQGRNSYSRQIADALAQDIYNGVLQPDSPLPGTRELAERFGVTQPTVLAACDLLQQEDLIIRQPRRKIYVKAHGANKSRELLYFSFGDDNRNSILGKAIHSLIENSSPGKNYNFFTRIFSGNIADKDQFFWEQELVRLRKLGFLDCAVIHAQKVNIQRAKQCMTLPFPIVFMGDLPDGAARDLNLWQLSPDSCGSVEAAVQYAYKNSCKRLIVLRHKYHENFFWGRQPIMEFKRQSLQYGLELEFYDGGRAISPERKLLHRQLLKRVTEIKEKTLIVLNDFEDRLLTNGQFINHTQYPNVQILSLSPAPQRRAVKYLKYDFSVFNQTLCGMIEDAVAGRITPQQNFGLLPATVLEENIHFINKENIP